MKFSVDKLCAGYAPGSQTIQDVSFEIDSGETVCLLGRNGVGKTTTLKAVMGLVPYIEGSVCFDGKSLSELPIEHFAHAGIGYVPQGRRLFNALTVQENLEVGAYTRRDHRVDYERVFELFPGLKDRIHQISGTLSGGEQQMLAMARAICLDPKILLLDEPSEGLMPAMVSFIAEFVQQLKSMDVSVVMVEQRLDIVQRVANHICLMDRGTIVKSLSVEGRPARIENLKSALAL